MCVFELDYSKSAQSSVTLSSKIGIDSLGFSFEASGFSERFEKFYADYASARNPSSFKRDTRIESKWEMLRDCFSFSLLFSFLVRLIFACKIREKHTRARASFPSAGKITFRKIHFRSFALSLARASCTRRKISMLLRADTCTDWRWITSAPLFTIFSTIKGRIEGRNRGDG